MTSSDSLYFIPAETPEKERLAKQYAMKKSIYGWEYGLPSIIAGQFNTFSTVLDIAAGTCVWILDVAQSPLCQSRLETSSGNPIRFYACDIETGFFPDVAVTDRFGITTFQQDATKSFPQHMYGAIDLIHISFLAICLTESGWKATLDNCSKLLKPGGFVIIDELDPILFRDASGLPPDGADYELEQCMKGNTWLQKANCIYTAFSLHRGFIPNLTVRLPAMAQAAGLQVTASERGIAALGKACRTQKGLTGTPLSEYENFSVECMDLVFKHQAPVLMKDGVLEAPDGTKVNTPEALEKLLSDVSRGLRDDGAVAFGRCLVARR